MNPCTIRPTAGATLLPAGASAAPSAPGANAAPGAGAVPAEGPGASAPPPAPGAPRTALPGGGVAGSARAGALDRYAPGASPPFSGTAAPRAHPGVARAGLSRPGAGTSPALVALRRAAAGQNDSPALSPEQAARLARGCETLAALRALAGDRSSWTGLEAGKRAEVQGILKDYYSVLALGDTLRQRNPDLDGIFQRLISAISVPRDLQRLVREAFPRLGVTAELKIKKAETGSPLGATAIRDDRKLRKFRDRPRWLRPADVAVDDETVRSLFKLCEDGRGLDPLNPSRSKEAVLPEACLATALLAARGLELGAVPDHIRRAIDLPALALNLPPTQEAAAALVRLAKALDVDPGTLSLQRIWLPHFLATKGDPSLPGPLGNHSLPVDDPALKGSIERLTQFAASTGLADESVHRFFAEQHWSVWPRDLSVVLHPVIQALAPDPVTVVHLWARARELGIRDLGVSHPVNLYRRLRDEPGGELALQRLARAFGLPHQELTAEARKGGDSVVGSTASLVGDGLRLATDTLPRAVRRFRTGGTEREWAQRRAQQLAADLDRLQAGTVKRDEVVRRLLTGTDPALEVRELVPAVLSARAQGTLAPRNVSALHFWSSRSAAAQALARDAARTHRPEAAALLLGLLTTMPAKDVQAGLEAAGCPEGLASKWAAVAERLSTAGDQELRFLTRGLTAEPDVPDFDSVPLRLELLAGRRSRRDLEGQYGAAALSRAMLEHAALLSKDGTALTQLFRTWPEVAPSAAEISAGLSEGEQRTLVGRLREAVAGALAAVEHATAEERPGALAMLADTVSGARRSGLPSDAADDVLRRLYEADLRVAVPLGEVEAAAAARAGETAKPDPVRGRRTAERAMKRGWLSNRPSDVARTEKGLRISGVLIPRNDDPDRDFTAIPGLERSNLVMTPTTTENLRLVASAWGMERPVLLEGPTSAGKTSLVRFLAAETGSPYRRINLSESTTVYDLIGRRVKGERRYERGDLDEKAPEVLRGIARALKIGRAEALELEPLKDQILEHQEDPRWVDGPVLQAMKRGEVLLLDEINLASNDVLERLNSLFDDDRNLRVTEHEGELITPHPNFRIFATMNPATYAGRERLTEAMRSRWNNVFTHALKEQDLAMILWDRHGDRLPEKTIADLVIVHAALSKLADAKRLGRRGGEVAYTLRNLFKVAERFERYRDGASLPEGALLRRELQEIYRDGIVDPNERAAIDAVLDKVVPYDGPDFYADLEVEEDGDFFSIGDVLIHKIQDEADANLVPGDAAQLILTPRTKAVLYRLAKAIDMGENVALVGERASGKSAIAKMYARLRGMRYYQQLFSVDTDPMQLVGAYDVRGWRDGTLLRAGRPGGRPALYLADEFNLANPAILERLNPVLDDEHAIVLAEKDGERVDLDPDLAFVAAMNPPGRKYGGRKPLSAAMKNRFTEIVVPSLEDAAEEQQILSAIAERIGVGGSLASSGAEPAAVRAAGQKVASAIVELHHRVHQAYEDGTIGATTRTRDRPVLSIRQELEALKMVGALEADLGLDEAFRRSADVYYVAPAREPADEAWIEEAANQCAPRS